MPIYLSPLVVRLSTDTFLTVDTVACVDGIVIGRRQLLSRVDAGKGKQILAGLIAGYHPNKLDTNALRSAKVRLFFFKFMTSLVGCHGYSYGCHSCLKLIGRAILKTIGITPGSFADKFALLLEIAAARAHYGVQTHCQPFA